MFSEEELESQYDEEDTWEEQGFLEGMEEADMKKKRGKLFPDDLEDTEEDFEDRFQEDF